MATGHKDFPPSASPMDFRPSGFFHVIGKNSYRHIKTKRILRLLQCNNPPAPSFTLQKLRPHSGAFSLVPEIL